MTGNEHIRGPLDRLWNRRHGSPNVLSTAGSFAAPPGRHVDPDGVVGYPIDFSSKPQSPHWPPDWFRPGGREFYVAVAQWGLGCLERHLDSQDEEWLQAAVDAGDQLVVDQETEGSRAGAWIHRFALRHTFPLASPWVSGMAQGEGASLLVRLARITGDGRYAEAARRALAPMRVPSARGGVLAWLDGGPFCEEYPTDPPSFVLNGAIFGLWGPRDVAVGLGDGDSEAFFREAAETLAAHLDRYDTGSWSRYDLFPHPVPNLASAAYHQLHVHQLQAMAVLSGHSAFGTVANRFARYHRSRSKVARAFAGKVVFRLLVPRSHRLAHRLPWSPRP